jgi:Arc/MetJ-type ribon-helix-helix transcriptional regulator
LTVKLDDHLAEELEQFREEANYPNKSELVREALKLLMIEWRKEQLAASLDNYLKDQAALAEAADFAESKMDLTEEALQGAGDADSAW